MFRHLTTYERRTRYVLFGLLVLLFGGLAYYSHAALVWRIGIAVLGPLLMAWRVFAVDDVGRRRSATDSPSADHAIARADQLRKWDPVAADRVLDAHFDKEGEREDAERAALRTQAQTDPTAAVELRRRLLQDLEVWAHLLKGSRRKAGKDARMEQAAKNLEQWDKETRVELEQLDAVIKRFKV